jgi:hypothetical protein
MAKPPPGSSVSLVAHREHLPQVDELGLRCGPERRLATASRCLLDILLRGWASEFVSRENVGPLGRLEQD